MYDECMNEEIEERFYTSTFYKINISVLAIALIYALTVYILKLHEVMIDVVVALILFGYNVSTWNQPIARISYTNIVYGFFPLKRTIPLTSIKSVELKGNTMQNSKIIVLYDENTKQKAFVLQAWIIADYQRLFSILKSRLIPTSQVLPQQSN